MSDVPGEAEDGERLPWLEPITDDEAPSKGTSVTKLGAAMLIGLVAMGMAVGGLLWAGSRPAGGEGENTQQVASANLNEATPLTVAQSKNAGSPNGSSVTQADGRRSGAAAASQATRTADDRTRAAPARRASAERRTARVAGRQQARRSSTGPASRRSRLLSSRGVIQLGAFSTRRAADRAWRTLSSRYGRLQALERRVTTVRSAGRTLYRLRAAGAGSASLCRRVRRAGGACFVVR